LAGAIGKDQDVPGRAIPLPFLTAGLTAPLSLWQAVLYIMYGLQFDAEKVRQQPQTATKQVHFAASKATICWPAVSRGQHQDWLRNAPFLASSAKAADRASDLEGNCTFLISGDDPTSALLRISGTSRTLADVPKAALRAKLQDGLDRFAPSPL
jgi:hypothetical protein